MGRYIVKRLLQAIPTLLGVTVITFLVLRLSGDPAYMVLGETATREAVATYRAQHGLDKPLHLQYLQFMRGALTGDFGNSLRYREPVGRLLLSRLPATVELSLAAILFSLLVGVPVGLLSATRPASAEDFVIRALALLGQAIPGFFLGIVLIMLFSVHLHWFPTGGRGGFQHLVLPTVTLGAFMVALIARFTRSSLRDVLGQDYIRTARAKGLYRRRVILRHAFKNALIPVVTITGLQTAAVFSGAIVTETVFSWPGLGRFMVQAVYGRDFPVVQATVILITGVVVLINLIVDLIYGFVDPRIQYA